MTGSEEEGDPGPDVDPATAVGDGGAVEAVAPTVGIVEDGSQSPGIVELADDPRSDGPAGHGQWTIFDRGSSMMSLAPLSFRAGMRTFTSDLATTASTA
jgi:hypothetical protein